MNALLTLLQSPVAERIGWMLVHSLWQLALLAGVHGLLRHALRRRSANARYLAACAVMLCMVIALPLTALFVHVSSPAASASPPLGGTAFTARPEPLVAAGPAVENPLGTRHLAGRGAGDPVDLCRPADCDSVDEL